MTAACPRSSPSVLIRRPPCSESMEWQRAFVIKQRPFVDRVRASPPSSFSQAADSIAIRGPDVSQQTVESCPKKIHARPIPNESERTKPDSLNETRHLEWLKNHSSSRAPYLTDTGAIEDDLTKPAFEASSRAEAKKACIQKETKFFLNVQTVAFRSQTASLQTRFPQRPAPG